MKTRYLWCFCWILNYFFSFSYFLFSLIYLYIYSFTDFVAFLYLCVLFIYSIVSFQNTKPSSQQAGITVTREEEVMISDTVSASNFLLREWAPTVSFFAIQCPPYNRLVLLPPKSNRWWWVTMFAALDFLSGRVPTDSSQQHKTLHTYRTDWLYFAATRKEQKVKRYITVKVFPSDRK